MEACKKLYKKNIFDDLRFKKGIIHEDDDVFMDILFKIKTISIVKLPLYYYFMSENSIMRGGFSNKEFVRFDIDMKNVRYINRENIVSQKKLCMIPYLEHYLGFYYYIKSECPELMDSFKNYRNDYFKNILYAIRNKNLSKMFMILSIVFWVSPKLAKPLYNRII